MVLDHMDQMFIFHLRYANLYDNILFQIMESITYDMPTLLHAPVLNVNLVWSITRRILDWIQTQRQQVSLSFVFG